MLPILMVEYAQLQMLCTLLLCLDAGAGVVREMIGYWLDSC